MSRNKQRKGNLNHSAYTIEDGHGGLKKNAMTAGADIKPKDDESGSKHRAQAEKKSKAPKAAAAAKKPETDPDEQVDAGWQQIGKSGADIVKTYKSKNE